VRALHRAGIAVLAGTDANYSDPDGEGNAILTAYAGHGIALHHELELLVRAGLTPAAALAAATSVPARLFGLADRGHVAPGLRADLLLVDGDPATDITATRNIAAIWRNGVRLDREPLLARAAVPPHASAPSPYGVRDAITGRGQPEGGVVR
jgi:imidazolonepropionase-like amidohydrolase